jgi:hypothetical protein
MQEAHLFRHGKLSGHAVCVQYIRQCMRTVPCMREFRSRSCVEVVCGMNKMYVSADANCAGQFLSEGWYQGWYTKCDYALACSLQHNDPILSEGSFRAYVSLLQQMCHAV